jgi:hypothetical protein
MNQIVTEIAAIASSIIGLAIITVLVRQNSNTAGVIKAASGGFSQVLSTAMGGNNSIVGEYASYGMGL